MTDSADTNDDAALAGEYALGLLAPDEARVVEARMAEDEGFAALVRDWEVQLAELAQDVPPVQPPARVLQAIRKDLFADQDQPWWQKLGLVQALVGAAAAAAIAFAALQFDWLGQQPPAATYQASIAAEDQSLVVVAAYFEEAGVLQLDRRSGTARPGRALELWLIPEGQAPVSLGVLPATREAALRLPETLRPALAGATLAISDEPPGGSPTGAPTGDVLAAGPITEL